jgi:pimeloyl-ACP methyl ester carboxylesterase
VDRVAVNGLEVAFERAGEGTPLLLLHGALCDSRCWRPQLDGLADEFTVIAWDAPGCGQSADPPESWRLPDYADCVAAFAQALDLERPHVVGLSFGGGLALELFGRHRALPRTLVLAGAYAGWAGSLPAEVVEERVRGMLRDSTRDPRQVALEFSETLFDESTDPTLVDEVVDLIADFHPAGVRAMAQGLAEADLRHVLPTVDVPTLVLYGDADRRSPMHVARELEVGIPGARLTVIPGVGHLSNLEDAASFNREVRSFLRSVPA